jgi:hypothetical protein
VLVLARLLALGLLRSSNDEVVELDDGGGREGFDIELNFVRVLQSKTDNRKKESKSQSSARL